MSARARARAVAVTYVRAPTPEAEDDDDVGLEAQDGFATAYAHLKRLRIVERFVERDAPGGVPLAARPAGARLVELLAGEAGRGVAVVCGRLEWLFSSASECLGYVHAWRARGGSLHLLDLAGDPVSSETPEGELVLAVLGAVRAMELAPAHDRNHHPPHHERPRLGERVVRGYVVPDLDERHAVGRIRELARAGKSLRMIAQALDEEGVPTKRRAKAWSKEAIRLILRRIEQGEVPELRRGEVDEASD